MFFRDCDNDLALLHQEMFIKTRAAHMVQQRQFHEAGGHERDSTARGWWYHEYLIPTVDALASFYADRGWDK